jgi:phage-related protein
VSPSDKPLVWLHGEIKTPPFSQAARIEAGYPMPVVGTRCHELRVRDADVDWRIVYRADSGAIVLLAAFSKKTRATPRAIIDACIRRLTEYDRA